MDIFFKQQCIALRKQDKSILEIMRITGRAKSSIYPHVRNIPLSPQRLAKYRLASALWIKKFATARKGKSVRSFKTFKRWNPKNVLLVAHLMFDGELASNGCHYNNRNVALLNRVRELMEELYDFQPRYWQNSITGVHRISYYNVALGAYLKKKAHKLLFGLSQLSTECKRSFLRAFFDDEGCMDFRPNANVRRIRGYQKEVRVLRIVQKLLSDFGISSNVVLPNEVVISGEKNLARFEREINFSKGVRINGDRSNSRWKQHLEKRELLRRALASFKG